MLKTKKKSHSKLKRTAAIALAAVTIVSGCAISASAAVQRAEYKVECSSKDSCSFVFNATHTGQRSDVFDSYATIFNGGSYSAGYAYVKYDGGQTKNYDYNFSANSPNHTTVRFGEIVKGRSQHYYVNNSGSGFRAYCTTSQTY